MVKHAGWIALFVLVVVLGAIVIVSLPHAPSRLEPVENDATADASPSPQAAASAAIERPPEAIVELGILTDQPEDELRRIGQPSTVAASLGPRHCGAACDAVRAFIVDPDRFETDVVKTDDWGLPPKSSLDTVAPGLTPKDRESVHARANVLVVRAHGKPSPEQIAARAGFAAAAALAEQIGGLVYDEITRRIETPQAFAAHAITTALGQTAFRADRITIQLYQQDDGTERLLTLGMLRFGAPDLEVRGASPASGRSLGNVINAVAGLLAAGATELPLRVTTSDVAAAEGNGRGLSPQDPIASATVDLADTDRTEGDPDNDLMRIVPQGGATPGGYDELAAALIGPVDSVVPEAKDKEIAAASRRAKLAFPAALARWKTSGGSLLVKGPFPIPHGGTEWMWVEVTSCTDAECKGTLSNAPAYVPALKNGSAVTVKRADIYDYLLRSQDGTKEGGETITILEKRR